jgi:putative CRISPR-associated protein (TIGR02619 family)
MQMMANVIVSPCGTSILTNDTPKELRGLLFKTANMKEEELTPDQKRVIDGHCQQRRDLLLAEGKDLAVAKDISAELNGIITYYEANLPQGGTGAPDQHYLVVSDTYQGAQVGEMVEAWLKQYALTVVQTTFDDLSTNNRETFRGAMSALIQWCDQTLTGYRDSGYHVVFNLTGGFKSVIGFLQAVGMFYAHECVYIFQFSSQLLRIPQLPLKLDREGIVGEHLMVFRQLWAEKLLPASVCGGIPETLLHPVDDHVGLSEWGELIWLQAKPHYYQEKLLPPLSEKLRYGEGFVRNVQNLSPDRREIINERLDQLARYLDSNGGYNPRSLDFKPLRGNPVPGSTHECDGWSDLDARRLFGHFEEGVFVVDKLGKHL